MNNKKNSRLDKFFKLVESKISSIGKVGIGIIAVASVITVGILLSPSNDVVSSSVMITNMKSTTGGTGVIIESSRTESSVLTNSHVCGVIEKGGKVISNSGLSFVIREYTKSKLHDLCLIKVSGNLGVSTSIASFGPKSYYEKATISGHPSLYPNVVTSGHFSGRSTINVLTGFKKCTEEDRAGPLGFLCIIAGGLPIITSYEATLVTATIMPGSSGSGVYNENGNLSGLVFAGNRGLSYAWTVPYEIMKRFLEEELKYIEPINPPAEVDLLDLITPSTFEEQYRKLDEYCMQADRDPLSHAYCEVMEKSTLWRSK